MSHAIHATPVENDDKYAGIFADELARHGISVVTVLDAVLVTEPHRVLQVTLGVPDVANWELRALIHDVARAVEDAWVMDVVCFFRQN
jgi:hypothetical protein